MKIDLLGVDDLEKALLELKSVTAKSVARRVLKKAAAPVAETAKNIVAVDDGDLKNSIDVSTKLNARQRKETTKPRADETNVYVGPSYNSGKGGRHGHLVEFEFGTRKTSAQPFMRPAWEAEAQGALDSVTQDMRVEVGKTAARGRRRAAKNK